MDKNQESKRMNLLIAIIIIIIFGVILYFILMGGSGGLSSSVGDDRIYSVTETSDGYYLLSGYTQVAPNNNDAFILKIDKDGIEKWRNVYGTSGDDRIYSVTETSDGYYLLSGYTQVAPNNNDAFILKIDKDGIE
ncbi:MAG: hypothetical protein PHN37_02515, partial [Candidatus Pacebacteria bacterium]|nr:hypothetical protein [Candidatus Paceibacterota bacterium]